MPEAMEQRYAERLNRYVTAMRNEKPDRVPIRPFVAEFTARYAGYTCQEVAHDYTKAFDAVLKCAAGFDWDAVVPNMVFVWTGLTQAMGLEYYAIPGIDIPPDTGFQYIEPPEEKAYLRQDEYDDFIDDPVRFLFNVWLPRVSKEMSAIGEPTTVRNNLALLKGGMAMLQYFTAFGPQAEAMRRRTGTVSSIAGMLKAPMDILADKFRGYLGLCRDLVECPEKVLAACEALAPHLLQIARMGADPDKRVPIPTWMHRSCVPFISTEHFRTIHWATFRPILDALWGDGHQVLFYAEGNWNAHLETFAELPERSIVYHVDQDDVFDVHRKIGHRFCISGGVPNVLLACGTPGEVRDFCRKVLDEVAPDGGYIMDAGAIVQNDATVENVRAMTDATREFGDYGTSPSAEPPTPPCEGAAVSPDERYTIREPKTPPGVVVPWAEKRRELPDAISDEPLCRKVWEDVEAMAYLYIWHSVLSF